MTYSNSLISHRPLPLIARDIEANWDNPNAKAMRDIAVMKDAYCLWENDAHSAVFDFVFHSQEWKGEAADAIIEELLTQLDVFASGAKEMAEGARSAAKLLRKP
jgi:hypothetical protein